MSKPQVIKFVARHMLATSHPLHAALAEFCGDKEVTLRKARKFLTANPHFSDGRYDQEVVEEAE